jgi:AAA domain, putative AbiEii toxin, Type IV TA system
MAEFRREHQDALLEHAQVPKSDRLSTEHGPSALHNGSTALSTSRSAYSVDYDGVDIRKLSPSTRGIVLLLLYLALDDADDRPVIIDQPEEDLDPKSIFDELVGLFIDAKSRRQVIMVTHNAKSGDQHRRRSDHNRHSRSARVGRFAADRLSVRWARARGDPASGV